MEIIKSIDWAIDTIRDQLKFGLTDNPLAAAKRREARAKGVLLDCKKEIQSLKDQLAQSKKDLEKAEKVIEFYAKKENWTIDGHSFQDELNEIEQGYWACEIRNDGCDFNVATGYGGYGGKKARAYFKEKQDQLKESE